MNKLQTALKLGVYHYPQQENILVHHTDWIFFFLIIVLQLS